MERWNHGHDVALPYSVVYDQDYCGTVVETFQRAGRPCVTPIRSAMSHNTICSGELVVRCVRVQVEHRVRCT